MTEKAIDELAGRLEDAGLTSVARDAPLGTLTTYRVGGRTALLVDASSEEELRALRDGLAATRIPVPVLVVGKGSNLLVADAGFRGVALRLGGALAEIDADGEREPGRIGDGPQVAVRAGGGVGLPVLARRTVEAGFRGLEWAVGIPGSVGGALKMNAGGHGSDTASCLVAYRWVDVLAPRHGEAGPAQLGLGYRTSSLAESEVVVWADFSVHRGDKEAGRAELSEIVRWRREHQPGGSNAGSVFVNPPGDSAGRLVEAAGLKGFRLGSARVSEKHANFILADDDGSADDVRELMAHIRRTVAAAAGIDLRPEVKLVGFEPEETAARSASGVVAG